MAKLTEIEGIGNAYAGKLGEFGIHNTNDLIAKGATPSGRKEIAEKTGISEKLILEWVNHVDLYRIKGIGSEYADLLECAGVDTVPELANRKAENLVAKLAEINAQKKLVRRLPVLSEVTDWVEQAKKLPRAIFY